MDLVRVNREGVRGLSGCYCLVHRMVTHVWQPRMAVRIWQPLMSPHVHQSVATFTSVMKTPKKVMSKSVVTAARVVAIDGRWSL